jgi:hypothetical protein
VDDLELKEGVTSGEHVCDGRADVNFEQGGRYRG